MYYNTSSNRADGPTRGRRPDPPDLELPRWWEHIDDDDFREFDCWMQKAGVPDAGAGLPYEDIAGSGDLDLRSRAGIKKKNEKMKKRRKASAEEHSKQVAKETGDPHSPVRTSKLDSEVLKLLHSLPRSQFFFAEGVDGFYEAGALDLYSGRFGVAKQMIKAGAPWVLTYEWNRSAGEDLLQDEVRQTIRLLLRGGAFKTMGAAPICSSFSIAVTPPVRSRRFPRGLPGFRHTMRKKVADGNSHNDFMIDLVDICGLCGVTYFVENPDTSFWWAQRRWKRWQLASSGDIFRLCFCRFGTPWKKATRIATNSRLAGCRMMCTCRKKHRQLRGMRPTKRIPWTLVAQPYPLGLCRLLALALCQSAKWSAKERLDVKGCAKLGSLRPGEAQNPGPRAKKRSDHASSLFDMELITAQTLALESRQLQNFCDWCRETMPTSDFEAVFKVAPEFLATLLTVFAEHSYQHGGALSNFRHLILACQRWMPASRQHMARAWEMVERWELIHPVTHRVPVPEMLMQAMCVIAWQRKWFSWVGATILAFYGAGRLGEVLRCGREDLVLPEDVLEPPGSPVFLRLRTFKSKMRQPAKVQHMKVEMDLASLLLSKLFAEVPPDEPLFAASPYQYRKRWDILLATLGIPKKASITPGGLRGGAAVYHYKRGRPVQDLLWLLRLRSQSTLESYLQEVAALNALVKLPDECRTLVKASSSCFAFLVAGECSMQGS